MSAPQLGSLPSLAWNDLRERYDALLAAQLTPDGMPA
jgi:hypothetical protein